MSYEIILLISRVRFPPGHHLRYTDAWLGALPYRPVLSDIYFLLARIPLRRYVLDTQLFYPSSRVPPGDRRGAIRCAVGLERGNLYETIRGILRYMDLLWWGIGPRSGRALAMPAAYVHVMRNNHRCVIKAMNTASLVYCAEYHDVK